VIINVAMTTDGKIDTIERRGAMISSAEDWVRVDRLRAESDAVMVGGRTLIDEDPRLTVKSPELRKERLSRGQPENPIKVGVISQADLELEGRFINEGSAHVLLFTSERTSSNQIKKLKESEVEVFVAGEKRVDLVLMLLKLKERGIQRVLVEGGGTLNSALIQAGLVDEINVFIAPLIFGGASAPTLADGVGLNAGDAIQLQTKAVDHLEDGAVIIHYQVMNSG
jgi:2,5-diamino-6-(ribosylamino)-4(3H)-pyrimidinone 5'-phosphate reductase